ncbi:hypothetical protein M1M25_gp014 [Tenacibaculum phage Gundel_1]|uniref:Uncharacterized protein n=1 Tax=Tenacibaculum phage Gundel_1 TaxID=2745672 RepID=A0A8E4ZM64_9CAUD|nr:hypothetical protein M1M25_gp014 [Tenacibaculum phage Gundel_1]QQV91444.1 hypothetical protein Gundel1_14 [Tenacibaculum phage Gundel_1]
MNQLFLTLRAKKIMFSFERIEGKVTKITNIELTKDGRTHLANGRIVSKNLYNELLKIN